jgi:septal ring factor EnvC (AmiA/AmiB activator)
MRTAVASLLVTAGFGGICQKGHGAVKKGMCPFRRGLIKKYYGGYYYGDRMVGETIFGNDSIVIATKDGIVETLFDIGDVKAVMIRKGIIFYTYANLDTVFVQKGESVRSGEAIGICLRKALDLVISDTSGNNRWPAKYLDCEVKLIKQK